MTPKQVIIKTRNTRTVQTFIYINRLQLALSLHVPLLSSMRRTLTVLLHVITKNHIAYTVFDKNKKSFVSTTL